MKTAFCIGHTNLIVAAEGKVLSEWVTFKAVVGENAPQVWVVVEEDAKHVVNLSLIPVCGIVHTDN